MSLELNSCFLIDYPCGQQKVKGGNGSNIASSSASSIPLNLGVGCAPSCWPIFGFRTSWVLPGGAEGSFLCSPSSNACDYEIVRYKGERFPPCPRHNASVGWTLVRPIKRTTGRSRRRLAACAPASANPAASALVSATAHRRPVLVAPSPGAFLEGLSFP